MAYLRKVFTLAQTSKQRSFLLDSAQRSDLALFLGDLSQNENISEIKPPLDIAFSTSSRSMKSRENPSA